MRSAVITTVSGRHAHLRRQRESLRDLNPRPDLHVVVALGDRAIADVVDDGGELPTVLVELAATGELPLAAGRNAGAAAAIAAGAELLVFLDVDCLAGLDLLTTYDAAASAYPEAVLCGPVTYLPPTPPRGWTTSDLEAQRRPHAARPDPPAGAVEPADYALFWSLSFALRAATWQRVGGFCEDYLGYGAEDTDFGQLLRKDGIAMWWVGGADAFHQHHPSANPPVQHVDAVLRNGAIFAARWGWWPMAGWLDRFADVGLVRPDAMTWQRTDPLRVLTIPAQHPYLDAVRPANTTAVDPRRVIGWEPDPLLDPQRLCASADSIDVVHVHFGYDHLTAPALADWLGELDRRSLPLVLTVHDLRNPHHDDPRRHDAHLRALTAAADAIITLTPGAAAEIRARFGREAQVIMHPTLLECDVVRPPRSQRIIVPLKSLRTNVAQPATLVGAVVAGAQRGGGRVQVDVHPDVIAADALAPVREWAADGRLDLHVHARFDDEALIDYVAAADVCVLPYRFGTHSGWVELGRDLGTTIVAPDCGFYADQWDGVITYPNNERDGLDPLALADAVEAAIVRHPPPPAEHRERRAARDRIRIEHEIIYRRVARR